jgi:phosphatidylglycerophosphate synthase
LRPTIALTSIPMGLIVLRAVLGPAVLLLAFFNPNHLAFGTCLVLALLSDYFDGVIARRLGVATPNLRRMDSIADSIFYISALVAAWYLHGDLLKPHLLALALLGVIEVARYIFDYFKFGKEASYHMWSSKFWGLTLFIGFFALFVYEESGWPVSLAIYAGIIADIEGFAISVVLKQWKNDVPTIFHAIRLHGA